MARRPNTKQSERVTQSVIAPAARAIREGNNPDDIVAVEPGFEDTSQWLSTLTPKQSQYLKLRASGHSPGRASEIAYGSRAHAKRNESNPVIQAALKSMRQDTYERLQVTRERCVEGILEAVEMARIMAEPATMIAGYREVGKMLGFYEPERKEVAVVGEGGRLLQKVSQMSDEQLLQLLTKPDPAIIEGEFTQCH